jgi:hypothetical protein
MVASPRVPGCVAALWSLIGAARSGAAERIEDAAQRAAALVGTASGDAAGIELEGVDGALRVNGTLIEDEVASVAANGLCALLRSIDLAMVRLDRDVEAASLASWAAGCVAAEREGASHPAVRLQMPPTSGVHCVGKARDGEPVRLLRRGEVIAEQTDSRLRSVFLQHQLMAGMGHDFPLPPAFGKVVVQAVVDRLLALPGGLDPLMLLQQDGQRLRAAMEVATLSVLIARVAGWPDDSLADLGVAALLHDVGSVVDPSSPDQAGFAWLVGRGVQDVWLRCALVARGWREPHGASVAECDTLGSGTAAVVGLAVAARQALAGGATLRELPRHLAGLGEMGAFPRELVGAAAEALRAVG